MLDTARKLPPYVPRERSRHGRVMYYFRFGKGARLRLPAFGEEEFDEAYRQALAAHGATPKRVVGSDSLEWLIDRYRETQAYQGLSDATRRQRDNIFKGVLSKSGHRRYKDVAEADVEAGKDARAGTPAQARCFLDAIRGLFRWAKRSRLVNVDPTASVANPRRRTNAGFVAWTEVDAQAYEARWPLGARQRVWLDVLLYTGLRRGDAVRLGRQHVRDGVATLKTEKSGFTLEVVLPILPVLAETLAAGPCGDLSFIVGANGKPLIKESFGNEFKTACKAAGVPGSAHGVRKIAATRAANAGATVAQLEAIFGWTGGTMASHYTRSADRRRLAAEAMAKLANAAGTSIPAPSEKVRAEKRKDE